MDKMICPKELNFKPGHTYLNSNTKFVYLSIHIYLLKMYLNDSVRFCTFLSIKVSKTRHFKHLPFLPVPRIKHRPVLWSMRKEILNAGQVRALGRFINLGGEY